jgi:hypothetical protein
MLNQALRISRGSKVHSTRRMPVSRASSALFEFEEAANAASRKFGHDAGHVGVQVGPALAARFEPGDGEEEADHAVAVEGAEDLAADLGGDDEEADGEQFDVARSPRFPVGG